MLSSLLQSSSLPVLEQVVDFAQARHHVLAGNIANLDTPGYRTRDLSPDLFQERLREAVQARDTSQPGSLANAGSLYRGDPVEQVSEDMKSILFHDDSNVNIEQQLAEVSKNQMTHNRALTIMAHQFRLLHAAISERP